MFMIVQLVCQAVKNEYQNIDLQFSDARSSKPPSPQCLFAPPFICYSKYFLLTCTKIDDVITNKIPILKFQ